MLGIGAGGDGKDVGHAGDACRGNSNRWSAGRSRCGGTILKNNVGKHFDLLDSSQLL